MKILKYHLRGAIYGFLLATIFYGFLLYPHTQFRIQATNQNTDQLTAMDTAESLAMVMPQVKPKVGK